MNDIALKRLYEAGWTPDRKVDITPIEEAYASENMVIPDRLREFFISYGFLVVKYDIQHTEPERHSINPIADFKNYSKEDFAHLLDDYEIYGMAYPVGFAYRGNMSIYYHDDGNFYVYMEGGPLFRAGSGEDLIAALCGDRESNDSWVEIK